jgi:hypothetical protein
MPQLSLYHILKAYQQGGVEGVVRALGFAHRTVAHRLATASADELKTAYQRLLWEHQRQQQGLADRVQQLDAERAALVAYGDFQVSVWQSRNRKRSPGPCLAPTPPSPGGRGGIV